LHGHELPLRLSEDRLTGRAGRGAWTSPGSAPILLHMKSTARPVPASELERESETPHVHRLLLENHARFLAFVERRVGSRDEAEDILQEAFVRSLDRAATLRRSDSVTAWFYRVLRNAIIDHFRRQDTRGRAHDRLAAEAAIAGPGLDEEIEAVVCACVLALVDTLKPEYGAALRRVELDGQSVRGYAEEAGITPGNAGVRLHRAREALRKQLARSCGTCLEHGCVDCRCGQVSAPGAPPAGS
jgi:RNA polymerase sigma factor (sigma-70 family)